MSALTAAQRAAAAGLELTVLRRLDGLLQGDHGGLLPATAARRVRPGSTRRATTPAASTGR